MYADYHVHSNYSDDSDYLLEDVIKDAINLGIDEICLTDHVDYGTKEDVDSPNIKSVVYESKVYYLVNVDYEAYFKELSILKEKYKDKITIKKGLELGVQRHTIDKYESLLDKYPLDFAILSFHQIEDKELWTQDYQRGKSQKEYYEGYYNEVLEVIKKYRRYSVLGHLDLINRYDLMEVYPFEKVKDIIAEILKIVIKDNKGIEFNTSYHRYGLKDTTPSIDILKLYLDLGGKIITIGSDTHKKETLGFYIQEAKGLLRSLGYKEFCTFSDMMPIYHSLD